MTTRPHPDTDRGAKLPANHDAKLPAELEAELAALTAMDGKALRARWCSLKDSPVPRISPALLRLALAWELQAMVHGGLSRASRQQLAQIAGARTVTQPARPGMRLVREWNGKLHVITIDEHEVIHWNAREWRSLSEVARAITGTRWSGPAFFGLRRGKAAA